jgi:hypothetical protein
MELQSIRREQVRLRLQLRKLNARAKVLEESIADYIADNDTGFKFQGNTFELETKTKRLPKKKAEAEADCLDVLRSYVDNPEYVFEKLQEARKGEETEVNKLKFKKEKKRRS